MLRNELSPEEFSRQNDYLREEFARCAQILNLFEQHGITYLSAVNGGGAAAVIGFAGSAQYAEGAPVYALIAFLVGTVATGLAIAIGHRRLSRVCDGFAADHTAFNFNKMRLGAVSVNHSKRFSQWRHGVTVAYFAALCFIVGVCLSVHAFQTFPEWKAAKDSRIEAAKPTTTQSINVTCVTPEKSKQKITR